MRGTRKDYAVKRVQNPIRRRKGERKSFRGTFWYVLASAVVVFLGVVAYGIFFTEVFKIKNIEIAGSYAAANERRYRELLNAKRGSLIWFSRFSHELEEIKKHAFVRRAVVKKKLPDSIILEVEERFPAYVLGRGDTVYTIDQDGFVLQNTIPTRNGKPTAAKPDFISIVIPTTTPDVVIGKEYEPKVFSYIKALIHQFREELGIHIQSLAFQRPAYTDVKVVTDRNWYLLIDMTRPVDYYTKTLKIFLSQKAPEETRYEYFDLRILDMVYWK